MKKIYNSPMTNIVKLKVQAALMEASVALKNVDANSDAMGREGSSWDED